MNAVAGNGGQLGRKSGEVKFLWSVLAIHRLKLLQNKENKLYPSFGASTTILILEIKTFYKCFNL